MPLPQLLWIGMHMGWEGRKDGFTETPVEERFMPFSRKIGIPGLQARATVESALVGRSGLWGLRIGIP